MARVDIWPTVQAERKALAADLDGLSDERWTMQSLCDAWTVRDVLAHMTATAKITPGGFFPKLISSGFSFNRMQEKDIAFEHGATPADTLHGFDAVIPSKKSPPGPRLVMMGETLIHSEDIRRPLGIPHAYPTEWLKQVADFYKGSNLVLGTKGRIAGGVAASHRHRLVTRERARGVGAHAAAASGHNRSQSGADRAPGPRGRRASEPLWKLTIQKDQRTIDALAAIRGNSGYRMTFCPATREFGSR